MRTAYHQTDFSPADGDRPGAAAERIPAAALANSVTSSQSMALKKGYLSHRAK